ncbi:MAG: hypothetical protein QOD63_1517 [Actinomycetota bacterium]|nr:hypothetical protein [Actinomycetota bacterium]
MVLVLVGVLLAAPLGCGDDGKGTTGATSTPTTSTPVSSTSTASPTTTPSTTAGGPVTTSPFGTTFAYQPLWPFRSLAEADAWQESYRSGGHQPWHLDAAQTALSFASGYLGYTEIDKTTSTTPAKDGVLVAVGSATEGGRISTAAVVHLLRFGAGTDAPWEIVGTEDKDFSLTEPRYGATVTSPLTVGGLITGVDESIHVQVRQLSSEAPIGDACCVGAGGDRSPWQATVTFQGATDHVLTVAASTGGHLLKVERFTVTAVRV